MDPESLTARRIIYERARAHAREAADFARGVIAAADAADAHLAAALKARNVHDADDAAIAADIAAIDAANAAMAALCELLDARHDLAGALTPAIVDNALAMAETAIDA